MKDQEKTAKSNQNPENEDFQANVKVRSMKDKDYSFGGTRCIYIYCQNW